MSKKFVCKNERRGQRSVPVCREVPQAYHCKSSDTSDRDTYDVVIVGVGTAGAVAAEYISRSGNISVLALEAGQNENANNVSLDLLNVGPMGPFSGPQRFPNNFGELAGGDPLLADVMNNTVFTINEGTREYLIEAGRGWGGASLHSNGLSIRSSPGHAGAVQAKLAGDPNAGKWSPAALNALHKELEFYDNDPLGFGLPPPDPDRGTSGRWVNAGIPYVAVGAAAAFDEALKAEYPGLVAFDGVDYNGNNDFARPAFQAADVFFDSVTPTFLRTTAGNQFLGPDVVDQVTGKGVDNRRLQIISDAFVDKVLFSSSGKAKKVVAIVNGKRKVYRAQCKILICAGGTRSPGILERSGIGSAAPLPGAVEGLGLNPGDLNVNRFEGLNALGIPVVVDNPHVGEHYQTHPFNRTWISTDNIVSETGVSTMLLPPPDNDAPNAALGHNRQLFMSVVEVPAFQPEVPESYPISKQILETLGVPKDFTRTGDPNQVFVWASLNFNLQPTSEGYVHIANANPETNPNQTWNMHATEKDRKIARDYAKLWKRVAAQANIFAPGLNASIDYPPPDAFEGPGADDRLDGYLRGDVLATQHQAGACRMAASINDGVVDANLHVFGVQNLMVADVSIWPIIPDANTQWSAAVAGLQAAKIIVQDCVEGTDTNSSSWSSSY